MGVVMSFETTFDELAKRRAARAECGSADPVGDDQAERHSGWGALTECSGDGGPDCVDKVGQFIRRTLLDLGITTLVVCLIVACAVMGADAMELLRGFSLLR